MTTCKLKMSYLNKKRQIMLPGDISILFQGQTKWP